VKIRKNRETKLLEAVLPYKPKIEKKIDLIRTRDDFRIFGGWYATLKEKGEFKYSREEILNKFLVPCVKELIREGSTEFHPESWKKWPREIYLQAFDDVVKKFRYLVKPHGTMIWEGKKTATVHARRFIQGAFFSIVEEDKEFGFARFEEGRKIDVKEFEKLRGAHRVSDEERKAWWPDAKVLYFYKLRTWIPFDKPRKVKVPKGIRTYGTRTDLKEGSPPPGIQKQKINSPTFAYMAVYGKEPDHWIPGRTGGPEKEWKNGIMIDEHLKPEWFEALSSIAGIEIRASCEGHSPERVSYVVFRFRDKADDDKAGELAKELELAEDEIFSLSDVGTEGRPRICVAGKTYYGQSGWKEWWESLAGKVKKCVGEVLKEGFAAEIFSPQDYEPDKLEKLSDEELLARHKKLIEFFRQRGSRPGDELVKNAYRFVTEEIERRALTVEFNSKLLTASKGGALDEFLIKAAEKIHELGQIIWKPRYVSLTGSALFAKERLPNDLDTVFRDDEINPALLLKVDRIFEKYLGVPSHPIPESFGPNWRHLPIWDLALVPTKELEIIEMNEPGFIKEFYEAIRLAGAVPRAASEELRKQAADSMAEDKIVLSRFFLTLKPTRPAFPEEKMTLDSLLKYFKPEDFPVNVEKKYDGANHEIAKDGDKVSIISEDGEDNTARLPQTVEAVRKLKADKLILLDEIEAWEGKKHLPREVVSGYLHSKSKPDDSHLVSNIYGVVFVEEDLHKKGESERRAALEKLGFTQSTVNEPDLEHRLNLVPAQQAKNLDELKKVVEDLRKRPGSEGVVVKKHKAIYYLDRNSRNGWFKLHNTAILAGIVVEVVETKVKGVYNYRYAIDQEDYEVKPGDLAEVRNREWLEVGKTFSTEKKVARGDIIEIEFETLNFIRDERSGTVKVTAWVPRFMGVMPERSTPDKVDEVVKRARKNKILREKTITTEGKTVYESLDRMEVEYLDLDEYKQFLKEAYGIDEGTIEWYLGVEKFLEAVEDLRPTEKEIEETEKVDPEFAKALRKAQAKARKLPRFWAVIQNHFRGKSQHKDFRVKMNEHLRGWTITDQPEGEITKDVETVKDGRYWQERIRWKFRPDMDPATHCVAIAKAKQPTIWLMWDDNGMGKYAAARPGSVTATRFEWGVMIQEDAGYAYLTVKKPYFEEYFLDMKHYKGRMVIRLIGVGEKWKKPPKGKLQWQSWFNLKDQTPYILTRRARLKKDYIPDGVHTTNSGLPPEWEKKIPIAMRWWLGKLTRAEKFAKMDQAYNYLIEKGKLKGRPLKESPEPKLVDFIIRRHWWRGQIVVRGMPVQHWDLVIDAGRGYLDEFNLELDPLINENLETGIPAFRKKCKTETPKGESFQKWMEFEGSIPPNHPEWGNPNKKIPAYMKIVDRGKVNWIENTELFCSFEFKGKALKGYVALRRESPDADIWVMRKAALPGEKRKEALELMKVG